MVTTAKKRFTTAIRFKKEWLVDPGPELVRRLGLNQTQQRALTRDLNQAKKEFQTRVNEILANVQKG